MLYKKFWKIENINLDIDRISIMKSEKIWEVVGNVSRNFKTCRNSEKKIQNIFGDILLSMSDEISEKCLL